MMSNKEVYIFVIIISIIIYATKTRILYKKKNGECPERYLEVFCCWIEYFILILTHEVIQFFVSNIIMYPFTRLKFLWKKYKGIPLSVNGKYIHYWKFDLFMVLNP